MTDGVRLEVLGTARLSVDGQPVPVPRGLGLRLLLMLVADQGHAVDDDELIERLWDGAAPTNARYSLRNTVARLRATLGPDALIRTGRGYRLDPGVVHTDVAALEQRVAHARALLAASDPATAAIEIDHALGLLRGPALDEVRDEWWALAAVARIEETEREAEDIWATSLLQQRRPSADDLVRMRAVVTREPLREQRWAQLIDALAASGRRIEALRTAQEARRALREFGIAAGTLVREAEQRALDSTDEDRITPGGRRLADVCGSPFVGRHDVLAQLVPPPRIAVVRGGPGSGCTRVIAEMAQRSRQAGLTVLYVSIEAPSSGLRPVVDLAREAIAATAVDHSPDDVLLALVGQPTAAHVEHPIAEVRTARTQRALAEAIAEAGRGAPILVAIDNAHLLGREAAVVLANVLAHASGQSTVLGLHTDTVPAPAQHLIDRLAADVAPVLIDLTPLAPSEIDAIVAASAPDLTATLRERITAAVAAHDGNPMLAVELARLAHGVDPPLDGPGNLRAVLGQMIERFDPAARSIVELLAVARRPLDIDTLTAHETSAAAHVDALLREQILVEVSPGLVSLRMGLLGEIVRAGLTRQRLRSTRSALVTSLASMDDPLARQVRAEQMLELHRSGDAQHEDLDDCVLRTLQDQVVLGDYDGAAELGRIYLDRVGIGGECARSTEILLLIARSLLAGGAVDHGHELLAVVTHRAERLGLPELLADVVLARGPLETGSAAGDSIAEMAIGLLDEIDPSSAVRRVQLATWAAHHLLNTGRRAEALALIDAVEGEATASSLAVLRSLVLTTRFQATLLAEGSLAEAQRMHADLMAWWQLTGDEPARAGAVLFEPQLAFASGSLDDVVLASAAVSEMATVLRRSDLRWLPTAIDAAVLLARGELDAARTAIDEAERLGNDLRCASAAPVAALHRLLLGLLDGSFAAMAPLFEPRPDRGAPGVQHTALWGLGCALSGDVDGARRAADQLAADPQPLLGRGGISWALVAMAAAETAFAARHEPLGLRIWDELRPWSGSGLSVVGVAYMGSADLWLGLAGAAAVGGNAGVHLIDRAIDFERTLGASHWLQIALDRRSRCSA